MKINKATDWQTMKVQLCFLVSGDEERRLLTDNNDKIQRLRNDVNEVKEILRDDIEKAVERDGKVSTLNERAGEPQIVILIKIRHVYSVIKIKEKATDRHTKISVDGWMKIRKLNRVAVNFKTASM